MIYRWEYIGPQPLFIFIFPSPSGRTYWSISKYAIKEKDCSSKNGATWEQLHTRFLFYLLSTFQAELLDQKPLITVTTHYPTHVSPSTGLFLFLYPLHFLFDLTALGHFPPAKMYCFCSSFYHSDHFTFAFNFLFSIVWCRHTESIWCRHWGIFIWRLVENTFSVKSLYDIDRMPLLPFSYCKPCFFSIILSVSKALNTLNIFRLSQMKDWHRETIVANQKSSSLFRDASLSSGAVTQCVSGLRHVSQHTCKQCF